MQTLSKFSGMLILCTALFWVGCDNSTNSDEEKVEPIPTRPDVPTPANDGLTEMDLTGITANQIVTAGTGTVSKDVETISVDVPIGATVEKVYLYWARRGSESNPAVSEITVNGDVYTGSVIGGPVDMEGEGTSAGITHRVDLSNAGIVGPGSNSFTVQDNPAETDRPLGASVVVFYSGGESGSVLSLYDGIDYVYAESEGGTAEQREARRTAVPVNFTFEAAEQERTAELILIVGDIDPYENDRPNSLKLEVGDQATRAIGPDPSPLHGAQGEEWDNFTMSITIPAGAEVVRVFPVSGPGNKPASLVWLFAGLRVPQI